MLNNIHITNVVVRDVTGGTMDVKMTGLLVVATDRNVAGVRFNDVLIDGATVYNTTLWSGIMVYGRNTTPLSDSSQRNTNVTIRNSVAHDVYGDGIVVFVANNALLENNVVYRSGLQPTETIGTPSGLWQWACKDCVAQFNESYENTSPGADGGAFDIDYFNDNNTVQYNYGHDNKFYCIAFYGSSNYVTTNSVFRYNVCADNGGNDINMWSWNGGSLDGIQIYNNTFYTRHGIFSAAVGETSFVGARPRFFKNNIVYSTVANPLGYNSSAITRDHNLYYYTGGSYSSGEPNSLHTNPLLNNPTYSAPGKPTTAFTLQPGSPAINAGTNVCAGISGCSMGARDYFGNTIPHNGSYDIGAYEGPGVGGSTPGGSNLLTNPGFESGAATPWQFWPTANGAVVNSGANSGSYAARITGSSAGVFQQFSGLSPNTTYIFRARLRAGSAGNGGHLYAKNFGGTTVDSAIVSNTSYTEVSLTFTTGASNTTAEVGLWRDTGNGSGELFADDFELYRP